MPGRFRVPLSPLVQADEVDPPGYEPVEVVWPESGEEVVEVVGEESVQVGDTVVFVGDGEDDAATNSSWTSQQVDHVVIRSEGKVLGPDGNPIVGSIRQNPQAQMSLDEWLTWSEWNKP